MRSTFALTLSSAFSSALSIALLSALSNLSIRLQQSVIGLAIFIASFNTFAMNNAQLKSIVEQRLQGDRTNACWAVATIGAEVATAIVCADPSKPRSLTELNTFEIGSVTKTMNGALLSMLIADGKLKLDDRLAQFVSMPVPSFEGKEITLRHLVSHTSGLPALPPRFAPTDGSNPYADITEAIVVGSLADVKLTAAPGTSNSYSNWGAMLLSHVLSNVSGKNYEALMRERLFDPLKMQAAFIALPATNAKDVNRLIQGHLQSGLEANRWDFPVNFSGVGGVRANLVDMIRYVQAHQKAASAASNSVAETSTTSASGPALALLRALRATHTKVSDVGESGLGWMRAKLNGKTFLVHEGGTGGFSSFVAFDEAGTTGVVILSDTSFSNIGGLSSLGVHLLDAKVPLGKPRKITQPSAELTQALQGQYAFTTAGTVPSFELRQTKLADGKTGLEMLVPGQETYPLQYDSSGDFFLTKVDAVVRPSKRSDGSYNLTYLQGGGVMATKRLVAGEAIAKIPVPKLTAQELAIYVGVYEIAPTFSVKVFMQGAVLMAQATGQGAFPVESILPDAFAADAFGIELVFKRGADGKIASFDLYQAGRITPGKKI
jgi:serine-type D-Ala-D-Ala carboxypeptidase/endopeptidase